MPPDLPLIAYAARAGEQPRYGDVSEMRWSKRSKGVFCYRMMSARLGQK